MINLFASFVVLFGLCFSGNAQEKVSFQITVDSTLFYGDSDSKDIRDTRRVEIVINANTGKFETFYGTSKNAQEINYNYVPKISKSQVLQTYSNESIKLHADIVLTDVELIYKQIDEAGHHKWTWYVYGRRKDKHIGTAAMMAIDSETGEVLFKKME
jgi:hypothetical protein